LQNVDRTDISLAQVLSASFEIMQTFIKVLRYPSHLVYVHTELINSSVTRAGKNLRF